MNVSDEALLKSGISQADLSRIKHNVSVHGGTLEEAVERLANRFRVLTWVITFSVLVMAALLIFSSPVKIIAGGVSFLIVIAIVLSAQPVMLAWKCWRHRRADRR
ncbi:hypothetical protein V462_11110 [Pantoea ananatis 15320]|uniref:hypothetical protein n=1 Tax=Pantoea ananas TaxID=553 RepID=UPI00040753A1|nr:hypothetical protein [Pantoea ananatis]PKC36103.1 hypothetical protein V462_11110 [Pantoea ananatis 15320]